MTGDNLTRAEAQTRAARVSPVSYAVNLDLTAPDADTFLSDTTIWFSAVSNTTTFVDLDAVVLRTAELNGRALDTSTYDRDERRLPLPGLGQENELRVVAECSYQRTGVGLHRFVDPTDGLTYLYTHFEPFDAHRVFACFDQPDLKARFTLSVLAPEGWEVVSNSPG